MADYYDIEDRGDGSFRVTPQDNPGCGSVIAFFIFIIIAGFFVTHCDNAKSTTDSSGSTSESYYIEYEETFLGDSSPLPNAEENSTKLFDLSPARIKQDTINILSFSKYEHTDLDGYLYKDCYLLLCDGNDYCVSYKLNGEYTKLTGRLHAQNEGCICWLEFYSGDSLIYKTPHLSEDNVSCDIEIDITDVDLLSIYFCSDLSVDSLWTSGWLISEDFIISK